MRYKKNLAVEPKGLRERPKTRKGFTLLEIIVVLGLFAILIGLVIANLETSKSKTRDNKRISDLQEIQLALELYFEQNLIYPNSLTDLTLAAEFINKLPTPPANPNFPSVTSYMYAANGSSVCAGYHLGAVLENFIPPLKDDEDRTPRSICTASNDFHGLTQSCETGTALASGQEDQERCYDVVEP